MITNNGTNEVIFKQSANNTSSFIFKPPANSKNILITLNSVTSTVASASEFLIVQTAPSSGVFATTGYVTSAKYSPTTTNSWTNESITTGLMISANYILSSQYYIGSAYIMNLNTTQAANSVGVVTAIQPTNGFATYNIFTSGISPTSSTTTIRIQMTLGLISSGTVTIYSLP